MITRYGYPRLLVNPPNPAIAIQSSASIECGCLVFIGVRMDNQEVATSVGPCSPEHAGLVRHFNMLLAESTVEPTDEDLAVVCERLLEQAARYHTD